MASCAVGDWHTAPGLPSEGSSALHRGRFLGLRTIPLLPPCTFAMPAWQHAVAIALPSGGWQVLTGLSFPCNPPGQALALPE